MVAISLPMPFIMVGVRSKIRRLVSFIVYDARKGRASLLSRHRTACDARSLGHLGTGSERPNPNETNEVFANGAVREHARNGHWLK